MKTCFFILSFFGCIFGVAARENDADSLVNLLSQSDEYIRGKAYYELVSYYRRVDRSMMEYYANEARRFALNTDHDEARSHAHAGLGIYYLTISSFDSAAYFLEQAKDVLKNTDAIAFANACNALGNVYVASGKAERGVASLVEGLRALERKPDKAIEFKLYTNITWAYLELKRYRDCITSGLSAIAGLGDEYDLYRVYILNNIAVSYGALGQIDSASYFVKQSIPLAVKVHDLLAAANAHFILGTIYANANEYGKAIAEYLKARPYREKLGNPLYLVSDLYTISELYCKMGEYEKGIRTGQEALRIASENNLRLKLGETYLALAKNFEGKRDYKNSSEYYRLWAIAKDSVYTHANADAIARMQTQYETEKKIRELAEANVKLTSQELKVQERSNQLVIAGAVILCIAAGGLVVYRNQTIKQQRLQLKAQLAEAQSRNAIQEERLRISQELHDNIGSQLTFVRASIDVLEKSVPDHRVADIKELTAAAIQELRKTVWLINKQSATVEEFQIKLREYIPANSKPPIQLSASGDLQFEIPAVIANQLFRVVQEAVNNSVKHAQATQIHVKLAVTNSVMSVQIIDDGVGFETNSPTAGFGLRNIEKRIKSVNGTVTIRSNPTETSIALAIPL